MSNLNTRMPKVSIVIVNYNGEKHLKTCLATLRQVDYPKDLVEIVVVDNASKDGSLDILKADKDVKLVENTKNVGFAKAVNRGVDASSGTYVALLNNDMKVEPGWLKALVEPQLSDPNIACTGSKVLSWDGKRIDFVLGMMNFEGRGFQIGFNDILKKGKYDEEKFMLFVNGGSMLVNKEVFQKIGGFDEDYFAFYEDVDFGWRVWLTGYKVMFVPDSVVYHRHHGSSSSIGEEKLQILYERNALSTIYKNYSPEVLEKVLPAVLLLLNKRSAISFNLDKEMFRIDGPTDGSETVNVPKKAVSYVMAVDDFINSLPELAVKREKVQSLRRRSDATIFKLFGEIFFSIFSGEEYQNAQIEVQKALGVYDVFLNKSRRKILIATNEVVADKMAGPGIRAWELANILSNEFEVILAVSNPDPKQHPLFEVKTYKWSKELLEMGREADVIICQGLALASSPFLADLGKPIVIDSYDPFVLSLLEQHKELPPEKRMTESSLSLAALRLQMEIGDFFMCASEKQKDFWLGILTALGRINPETYDSDVSLANMIDTVPFGIPSEEPQHHKSVAKGVIEGIGENDKLVLWGGGIYNWFDAVSLVKAMKVVAEKDPQVKLLFMGLKHPNPGVPQMKMANDALALSKDLELYNKNVFFNFGWVDYNERQNYFMEADCGISTHLQHVETRFSFRTRILDYIWAEMPIICTDGDSMSQLVMEEGLGITVQEGDVEAIAEAILRLTTDETFNKRCCNNLKRIKPMFTWEVAAQPLVNFCRFPSLAADKRNGKHEVKVPQYKRRYFKRAKEIYSNYGFVELIKRSSAFMKNRF